MGRACDAVSALESAKGRSSRGLEPLEHWLAGNPQKRWAEANLQIPSGLVAITMENKSKPKLQVMPMRSDERLAQKIAVEILPEMGPGKILDIGCGKGFLLYDFLKVIPDAEIYGIDISDYAIANSKPEIRDRLQVGNAINLPWDDNSFDLVISITTLHNLHTYDLDLALREMERVGKEHKYLCVESYRNEQEKANLLYWQVTCEAFNTPDEWQWWFKQTGYKGDHSFIYFE